jgi:hypothetical protein
VLIDVGAFRWSETTVPDATAALYRAELRRLDEALVAYRRAEPGNSRGGRANSNNGVAARSAATGASERLSPCSARVRSPADCAVRTSRPPKRTASDRGPPDHGRAAAA